MLTTLLLLSTVGTALSVPVNDGTKPRVTETCGYESCNQAEAGVLNVHIVPHTHDDVGWLKTVDQYYYGSKNNIQKAGVQYIIDSVVKELWEDPKRRFIYVETAFFWKWWVRQCEAVQDRVHTLVRQGRLQFVGGAWSMNDEAASHYQSTIDQFTWGLSKLNETFGKCGIPRVGWQIDPFGHSREFASLLAGMGYDGLFLGRIDYQDKTQRMKTKTMEMLWRGDDSLGKPSDLFTGVLYNLYQAPPGFCFDVLCDDEPIIDDPNSPLYNVEAKVLDFLKYVTEQSKSYATNNVIMTMGGDFTYQDATMWYKNLDMLIEYTNVKSAQEGLNIKLFYSTPDCYLKAVKDANPTLPTKQDDFFPYANDPHAYWTGYFTSRPTTKYFERLGNNYLQISKQLQVLANMPQHNLYMLNELKSAMGVMQHHDAITGTEKQHVTHDYERLLDQAISDAILAIPNHAFNKLTRGDHSPPFQTYQRCRFNESSCHVSENSLNFIVTVYNPLAWSLSKVPISIPVEYGLYSVTGPDGKAIETQLVDIPDQVINIPTRESKATHELVFIESLPALGYKSFYISKKHEVAKRDLKKKVKEMETIEEFANMNDYWKNIKEKTPVEFKYEDENTDDIIKEPKLVFTKKLKSPEPAVNIDVDKNLYFIKKQYTGPNDAYKFKNKAKDLDLDVMKDRKDDYITDDIVELEKLIVEAMRRIEDVTGTTRDMEKALKYPPLNDEEMRMLADEPAVIERHDDSEFLFLGSGRSKLRVHKTTGLMELIHDDVVSYTLDIGIMYYPGCVGDNKAFVNRSSGAYIFRPNSTDAIAVKANKAVGPNGPLVKEYRFNMKNAYQAIRAYNGIDYFEYEWLIGPIDITDDVGKEYIARIGVTNMITNGEFYTDSNGRQDLKRKLNKRPQWNVSIAEPISGNYYPVNNKISIKDDNFKVTLVTDRSHGGSSLSEGHMEVMLHRRLLHDDAFGVGEALNETAKGFGLVVRGKHRIFGYAKEAQNDVREAMDVLELHLQPQTFVANANIDVDKWLKLRNEYSFLNNDLPSGIHLLTVEPWTDTTMLLRFESLFETSDTEVDLSNIFKNIRVKSFRETTLAANQWISEHDKWEWNTKEDFVESFNKAYGTYDEVVKARNDYTAPKDNLFKIQLKPKQIRTFIVQYDLSSS